MQMSFRGSGSLSLFASIPLTCPRPASAMQKSWMCCYAMGSCRTLLMMEAKLVIDERISLCSVD